jgi:HlyD family secretion protein
MDVARPRSRVSARLLRAIALLAVPVVALGAAWFALGRAPAHETTVDRNAIVVATARRGELVRGVEAAGTLVPEHVRVVVALGDGFVDAVPLKPGAAVTAGTVIARLRNPDLDAAVADASAQIDAARAELRSTAAQSQTARLERIGAVRDVHAQREQAAVAERADAQLHADGLIADLPYRLAQLRREQLDGQEQIERSKLAASAVDESAKRAIVEARIRALAAALAAKQAQRDALILHAGGGGVIQSVAAELGQHVVIGSAVARLADPRDLKAVLQIPETQAHDVLLGNAVRVDTASGPVRGRVVRIDPAAQNGSVAADVALQGPIPPGLRPDSNVTATVEVARLHDVVALARPAGAHDDTTVDVFRLVDGGTHAVRVPIRLGTGTLDEVQVRSGLAPGDRAIVSDISAYAGTVRLRLQGGTP